MDDRSEARLLAIDYGRARIGVAVTDPLGLLPQPLPPVPGGNRKRALAALEQLCADYGVTRVLIGRPLHMDGGVSDMAREAAAFGRALGNRTRIPVEQVDERLTSQEAAGLLRDAGHSARAQRGRIDSAAAALILQRYLDEHAR
jgi:putative Holliday junction resolvase